MPTVRHKHVTALFRSEWHSAVGAILRSSDVSYLVWPRQTSQRPNEAMGLADLFKISLFVIVIRFYIVIFDEMSSSSEGRKYTGSFCAAFNCNNNRKTRPDMSFFRFPLDR
jgi:hypothetical protein